LLYRKVYNGNYGRDYNINDIVAIFFAVTTGAFAVGNTSPAAKAIAMGKEAGYNIYQVIERQSKIPLREPNSFVPSDIRGDIDFKNVTFSYPSRPDTSVLENLSLTIPSGKKVALVGETGCGKSTAIQLIERYYDTLSGTVSIDGRDIKEYNLMSLRKYIGYVGQEPVLFAMSIKENLLLAKPDATDAELYEALKQANAYGFVMKLERKMDTYVGAGGSQLSGGQKQRISIARSILQNPKILLLDEATSALDEGTRERDPGHSRQVREQQDHRDCRAQTVDSHQLRYHLCVVEGPGRGARHSLRAARKERCICEAGAEPASGDGCYGPGGGGSGEDQDIGAVRTGEKRKSTVS